MCSSITPIPPGGGQPMVPGQVVQIQSLPDGLQNVSRTLHLEAEVVRQNDDGSIRVRTAEGEIDIVVKGRQPQTGQRMELEIPPGSPPQKATARPAPQAPVQQPLPPQTGQQPPRPEQPVQPLPQTPIVTKPNTPPPVQGGTAAPLPKPETSVPLPPLPQTAETVKTPVSVQLTQPQDAQKPATYNASGIMPQTAKPAIPAPESQAAAIKPVGNNQQISNTLPVFKMGDIPVLGTGQIIRLVPITMPATNFVMQEQTIVPQMQQMQTENSLIQKPQGGMVASLLLAVKSAMPQSVSNAMATFIPTGKENVMQTITPAVSIATPQGQSLNPIGNAIEQLIAAPPVLEAKILSIKSPSGQIQILTPPNTDAETLATATQAKSSPITLNVTAVTPQKLPIVSMPLAVTPNAPVQNFVMQVQSPMLDTGAQITIVPHITLSTTPPQVSILPPAWRAMLPLMQPSSLWPVMDDLFQTFAGTTPQAAQILGRIIPSPANGATMGPAMMLFAAAIKSGDIQGWIGDKKMAMLQKLGKADMASRLSGETSSMTQNADAPATEWKSLPIPMLWQNEISKVLFHVRQEPRDDNSQDGETGTRFMFDLDLTRMGAVQLDGMMRGPRLDLIVRTKESISYPMQEAMKKAYADALDGTYIYGELAFQGDMKAWMTVVSGVEKMKMDL